jgi:hypothetical protein
MMTEKTKDYDKISIEVDGELIFVTVAKYKLFLSYGKVGMDAYLLYSHLMFTARLQSTNQVKAKDVYLRKGLNWGSEKLRKAKKLLLQLGIIEKIQRRDKEGHFIESYIKVRTKTTPFEIESIDEPATLKPGAPQTRSPGLDNKCLNEKDKCLNEKENALKFDLLWSKYDKKVGKVKALQAFDKITNKEYEKIMDVVDNYVKSIPNKQYRPNLSTFLNQKKWNDEIIPPKQQENNQDEINEHRNKKLKEAGLE